MRASTKRKAVSYSVPPLRLRKLGRTLVDLTKVQDDDDMGLDALEEEESKLDLFNMRMSGRQNIIGVLNANVHLGRQSEEEDEQPWLESEENQNWPVRWPTSARVPGPKSKPSDWELQKERLDWEKMQARIAWEKKQAAAGGGVEGNGVARSSSTLSSKFLEQGGDDRFAMDGDDLDTGYEMFEDTGRKKSRSSLEVSRTSVEKVSLLERTRVSQSVAAEERKARHLKILLEKACSVVNQHGLPEDQEQSLADALKEVHYSMKEFYQRFLRIELSGDVLVPVTSLLPKSIAATFSDEKQYIDTFGPLLLEESLFAVRTELNECQGLNRKSKQGLEVVCWRVCDNDNISLDSLDDGRQLTTAERHDDISSMTGRLVEMHICQPHKERHSELPDAERLINAGKPGHPKGCAPERSCWLVREDLVLVFALPPGRSYNNTQNMSISAIMRTPHILAVVGSSPTDTAPPTLIVRSSDLLNACMLRDWGTKPFGHWFVVPLASVATPAREWAALQAIRNNRLVPLTPYILTGSQVVSAHTLGSLKNHMKKKIETFEAIWKAKEENHQEDIEVWKHCTAIIASLARDVEVLASFRIDSSVLIKTDIVTFIKTDLGRSQMLKSYRDISGLGVCQDLLNSSKQLLDDWKARIKANENERVKQLKGKPITIRGYPSTSAVLQDDLDILPFNAFLGLYVGFAYIMH